LAGVALTAETAAAEPSTTWNPEMFPGTTSVTDCNGPVFTGSWGGLNQNQTTFAFRTLAVPGHCHWGTQIMTNSTDSAVTLYGLDIISTTGMIGGAFSVDGSTQYVTDSSGWFSSGNYLTIPAHDSVEVLVWWGRPLGAPRGDYEPFTWSFRTWDSSVSPTPEPSPRESGGMSEHMGSLAITKYVGNPSLDYYSGMGQPHVWEPGHEPATISGVEYTLIPVMGYCPDEIDHPIDRETEAPEEWCPGYRYQPDVYESPHDFNADLWREWVQEFNQLPQAVQLLEPGNFADFLGFPSEERLVFKGTTDEHGRVGTADNPWDVWVGETHYSRSEIGYKWHDSYIPEMIYYVYESSTPLGVVPGSGFFVSLPLITPEGLVWDVYAYPKNATAAVVKTVIDPNNCPATPGGAPLSILEPSDHADPINCQEIPVVNGMQTPPGSKVGDEVWFRVVGDVPRYTEDQPYYYPAFHDDLQEGLAFVLGSARLTFAGEDKALYGGWSGKEWPIEEFTGDDVSPDDYAIVYIPPLHKLGFEVSHDGKTKLVAQRRSETSGTLQFVLTFAVKATAQGVYTNTADFYPGITEDPIVSNPVTIAYGGKTLWKYAADCTTKHHVAEATMTEWTAPVPQTLGEGDDQCAVFLQNAQFAIFSSQTDAQSYAAWIAANRSGEPPAAAPLQFFDLTGEPADVDDPSNYLTSTALVASSADGHAHLGGLAYGTYWAVETTAPSGYSLMPSPFEVVVNNQADFTYFTDANDQFVANVPKNAGFPLPITGGATTIRYLIIAGAIMAGTMYAVKRQKREVS